MLEPRGPVTISFGTKFVASVGDSKFDMEINIITALLACERVANHTTVNQEPDLRDEW